MQNCVLASRFFVVVLLAFCLAVLQFSPCTCCYREDLGFPRAIVVAFGGNAARLRLPDTVRARRNVGGKGNERRGGAAGKTTRPSQGTGGLVRTDTGLTLPGHRFLELRRTTRW